MIDFLVIGGGIAGLSAAARLSHFGNVTLLEAEDALGYHTSGRSAAMFEETYGSPSTVALNRASRAYLTGQNGGVLSPRGMMLIGGPDDGQAFADDMLAMAMQPMSMTDALAIIPILNPDTVTAVGYHREAWDIDTDLLMQNFTREIRSNGGAVLTGQRVQKIEKSGAGWQLATANSDFTAKILINAAGSWVDQIAMLAGINPLGFSPLRRSIARIPAPRNLDVSAWPLMFGAGESWYAKPDAGKLIVSPADEGPAQPHDAWADDLTLAQGLARYQAVVSEPVTRLESSWAGLRTFSPDRSLVIGPDPADGSFFWVAGQGGYGMQTSPGASRLLADLISGSQSELPGQAITSLSPARFY